MSGNDCFSQYSTNTYVNVMNQYRPCGKADKDEFIKRRLTSKEYGDAVNAAKDAGLTRLDSRKRARLIAAVQQGQELTETPDM